MLYYIADTCEYQIWKMNVTNTVKPVLEQIEDAVTNGMSDFEKKVNLLILLALINMITRENVFLRMSVVTRKQRKYLSL